mmetsp:Transcript_13425/g.32343  ORF Transcript_13425/g.32343 Transcript_13425/m.32343 type:complete len:379 (+) Transcript_13425:146-1282(+)
MGEKVEEAIFKVKERQEFTCVFMDNTVSSIDEILNEYIPDKVEYKDVEDHMTTEQLILEAKEREMREEEELRQRRELERQLVEQQQLLLLQQEEAALIMEKEDDAHGSDFTSSSLGGSVNSGIALQFSPEEEQLSELGIETPAMREAKLSQETQNLFKEQQQMFAKYIQECRSVDQATTTTTTEDTGTPTKTTATTTSTTRFKGWFEEQRDKWREEEDMKELRRRRRQSQAVMMHKVKQMHSNAFHKVTEMKLHHHEQEEERKFSLTRSNMGVLGEESSTNDHHPPAAATATKKQPPITEEEATELLEEELRFSLTKGNLNDFFKQYKDSHSEMVGGGGGNNHVPSSSESQSQQEPSVGGFFGMMFGLGGKSENEMSC